VAKGDVLSAARLAGIMAAKRTPDLIPLCHPLLLNRVDVTFEARPAARGKTALRSLTVARCSGQTGADRADERGGGRRSLCTTCAGRGPLDEHPRGALPRSGRQSGTVRRPGSRSLPRRRQPPARRTPGGLLPAAVGHRPLQSALRVLHAGARRRLCRTPRSDLDEIEDILATVSGPLGLQGIRVTGGEPLVRGGIVDLVGRLARLPGIEDLSMTTNALLLPRFADELRAAGLRRVNVSLDTLDTGRYRRICRGATSTGSRGSAPRRPVSTR
jgi:hypothetical protein